MQRIFIVGCPRSGTTLLQSMLSKHGDIFTFPESHFFVKAYPRNNLKRFLTIPRIAVAKIVKEIAAKHDKTEVLNEFVKANKFYRFHEPFVLLLDLIAEENRTSNWIEKTPRHLHAIKNIKQRIPDSKFIHILRNGKDTVASMYNATNKYPKEWAKLSKFRKFNGLSLEECVDRWNYDYKESMKWYNEKDHHHIVFDKLIQSTENELKKLCKFLGLNYCSGMLKFYEDFNAIVEDKEKWKDNNKKPVLNRINTYREVFSEKECKYLHDYLINHGEVNYE